MVRRCWAAVCRAGVGKWQASLRRPAFAFPGSMDRGVCRALEAAAEKQGIQDESLPAHRRHLISGGCTSPFVQNKPPFNVVFPIEQAHVTTRFPLFIVEHRSYEFQLVFHVDHKDRNCARIQDAVTACAPVAYLPGGAGEIIPVALKITAVEKNGTRLVANSKTDPKNAGRGYAAESVSKTLVQVKLTPGKYMVEATNGRAVTEFAGTPLVTAGDMSSQDFAHCQHTPGHSIVHSAADEKVYVSAPQACSLAGQPAARSTESSLSAHRRASWWASSR